MQGSTEAKAYCCFNPILRVRKACSSGHLTASHPFRGAQESGHLVWQVHHHFHGHNKPQQQTTNNSNTTKLGEHCGKRNLVWRHRDKRGIDNALHSFRRMSPQCSLALPLSCSMLFFFAYNLAGCLQLRRAKPTSYLLRVDPSVTIWMYNVALSVVPATVGSFAFRMSSLFVLAIRTHQSPRLRILLHTTTR